MYALLVPLIFFKVIDADQALPGSSNMTHLSNQEMQERATGKANRDMKSPTMATDVNGDASKIKTTSIEREIEEFAQEGLNQPLMPRINKATYFKSQNLKDQKLFRKLMIDARKRYKNDRKAYYTFLTKKNDDGMTALMIASVTFDTEQVIFLLDEVQKFYGDKKTDAEKKQIFDYLDSRSPEGNSAFFFATQNGDFKTIQAMLERVPKMLDDNQLFLKFLNATVYSDKWTSLHWLVYDGATKAMEYFVTTVAKILGKNSPEYEAFINALNEDGGTPLKYALKANNRKFLIDHGATIIHQLNQQIQEAQALSAQFVEAMHDAAFGKMQKIMFKAQEQFRSNPDLFYEFISTKDDAGWDPLIHAVAQGRYEYVAFILYAAERYFKQNSQYIYDVLSSVSVDGQSPLLMAILRRNFEIAKLLIEKTKQYSKNDYLFYMIMNTTSYPKGLTPLLASVFYGSDQDEYYDITKLILEVVAERFGKNSHIMDLFVNSRNWDGFTALSYAASEKIKNLLKEYGGHE